MLRLGWMFCVLSCISFSAHAKELKVTSGEHDGFTRLAVELPKSNDTWQLTQMNGFYTLILQGNNLKFNTKSVFAKLSNARLKSLHSSVPNQLNIHLNCTCDIRAFLWDARFVILDIHPKPPQLPVPPAVKQPLNVPRLEFRKTTAGVLSGAPDDLQGIPLQEGENVAQSSTPSFALTLQPSQTRSDPNTSIQTLPAPQQIESKPVVDGILLATAHGLLEAQSGSEKTIVPGQKSTSITIGETQISPNLAVTNILDQGYENTRATLKADPTETCELGATLDIANWVQNTPFDKELARRRQTLMDDIADPNPAAALELVKFYLHFGFGAEAEAALHYSDPNMNDTKTFAALARLVDGAQLGAENPFYGMQDCDNPAAFWATLALGPNDAPKTLNSTAILSAFIDLPRHLRQQLGPLLNTNLLAHNYTDLAQRLLQISKRGAPTNDGTQALSQATIALKEGNTALAQSVMTEMTQVETEATPFALVQLVNLQFAAHKPIERDLAPLLAAYAIEYRTMAQGPDLRRAHVLARVINAQYETALQALETLLEVDGRAQWKSVLQLVAERISTTPDDAVFLRFALNEFTHQAGNLAPVIANAYAQRLLDLGLYENAQIFTSFGAEGAIGRERRKLRAQIDIQAGKPARAQVHLLGVQGPDIALIRAGAKLKSGDFQAATTEYQKLGDTQTVHNIAWQSGNWSALETSEVPYHQIAARLMNTQADAENARPAGPVLAQNRTLLTNSQTARAAVLDLLAATPFESVLPENEINNSTLNNFDPQ